MIEFKLPSLGADMDEGKLLAWKVKAGDRVKRGDLVAVVETPKAAVDVEIWQDGVVHELITQPGETIPVGTVMARLAAAGEAPVAAPAPKSAPAVTPAAAPVAAPTGAPTRHPVSPAARKHARELGVDVERLPGSGPHGAVTVEDVEKAAKAAPPKEKAPPKKEAPPPSDKTLAMRKAIAAAMSRSKREIPHYYLSQTIPMQRAVDWLTAYNEKRPLTGRVLMGALQLKAVAFALKDFPDLNGFWKNDAFEPASGIHVGVAISLRKGGLIAPAIHDVAELPLDELMKALADLVRRARAGSLRSSEMSDPTITVTNLGDQGVDEVFPIIYPPQVAIVGFGRLAPHPWAEDGMIGAVPAVVASLGGDHRASDGHRGARFLAAVAALLQEPEKLA
ncbi:MAG: 2-oxo acid dehydrogenase subunit E2 [Betaproteobacteria bacterium]|nr:2-oxo acid dehydrogenase subunit E2 [Betaproteobacteria bacterium]MDH5220920.1 2-oxo acid dehydrogenase subunit E2 [Betaproteobacteria bacterium]MDH5350108.1 2-oxo acid dehydrogenase subunit E2 [Betaproteobacteria bacterium]